MDYRLSLKTLSRHLSQAVVGLSALCLITTSSVSQPAAGSFSDDDVSWLFPAPHTVSDLSNLIAIKDVGGQNPAWSPLAFQSFVSIAEGKSQVPELNSQIGLPVDAHTTAAWFVAAIRIDPGAPGLSPDIIKQFGQLPEIRLILQPITVSGNTVTIHDYAAHLVFDFVKPLPGPPAQPGCNPQFLPDPDAFKSIMSDIVALKSKLAAGGFGGVNISTAGLPLGVHPGLANSATQHAVMQDMKAFLQRHLPAGRLDAMSVAGVPANAPKPWIFVSMVLTQQGYVAVPSPTLDGVRTAIALKAAGSPNRVVPMPVTNNGAPITCKSAALGPNALPVSARQGVSTADLFPPAHPDPNTVRSVTATIADPNRSHFFNTDCASCHTETRLTMPLGNPPGVDPAVLPSGDWVVRNFGWAPSGEGGKPTATRRTEAETRAVVDFLNAQPPNP
jgi:mono/diheme cytochrome c family protein